MTQAKTVDEAMNDLRAAMRHQERSIILESVQAVLNGNAPVSVRLFNGRARRTRKRGEHGVDTLRYSTVAPRRTRSPESRARQAKAMRRVWAARRKKARAGK